MRPSMALLSEEDLDWVRKVGMQALRDRHARVGITAVVRLALARLRAESGDDINAVVDAALDYVGTRGRKAPLDISNPLVLLQRPPRWQPSQAGEDKTRQQ